LAAVGRVDADERLDERRLAGAVVADERDDLLGIDREVRAVEGLTAAERLDDLARFEQGFRAHQVASAVGSGGRQRMPSTPSVCVSPAADGTRTVLPRCPATPPIVPSPAVTSTIEKLWVRVSPSVSLSARK